MAISDGDSLRSEQRQRDHIDPFTSLLRFVDTQCDRLAAGFHSIPQILSDAYSRTDQPHQACITQIQGNRESWSADRSMSCPFPDSTRPPGKEAQQAVKLLLAQAQAGNVSIDRRKITRLFNDEGLESLFEDFLQMNEPRWLSVPWFETSPYSPAAIEVHPYTHRQGSMWRAAFEDLLSAELGKKQVAHSAWSNERNDQSLYSAWAQAPRDWMLGLSCRGILPPHLPSLYRHGLDSQDRILKSIVTAEGHLPRCPFPVLRDYTSLLQAVSTFDADERFEQESSRKPETEQDLYEAFLGDSQQPTDSQVCPVMQCRDQQARAKQVDRSQQAPVAQPASTILSTLTTTERTTLPDGTTTTKVVLKRRFSDGREESSETVSTNHGERCQSPASASIDLRSTQQGQSNESGATQNKGWFWF